MNTCADKWKVVKCPLVLGPSCRAAFELGGQLLLCCDLDVLDL